MSDQLELPFLTLEDLAAIDAARAEVDRSQARAIARRAWAEADELGRLGTQLVQMLERHASAVRANHPTHRLPPTFHGDGQPASQDRPSSTLRRPEPTQ